MKEEDATHEGGGAARWRRDKRRARTFDAVDVLLLFASVFLALAIGFNIRARSQQTSDAACMRKMWAYSKFHHSDNRNRLGGN